MKLEHVYESGLSEVRDCGENFGTFSCRCKRKGVQFVRSKFRQHLM